MRMYPLACVFRILVVLVGLLGVTLQLIRKGSFVTPFVYFTVQSSTIVTVCFAIVAWATLRKRSGLPPAVKGAVTVYILITGLVFNLILSPERREQNRPPAPPTVSGAVAPGTAVAQSQSPSSLPAASASSSTPRVQPAFMHYMPRPGQLMHIVLPIMVLLDWLIFDPHRRYRWRYAAIWLAYPFAYVGFLMVRHAIFPDSRFPYSFVNLDKLGYGGMARNTVIYGVAFYLLGLIVVGVDRLLPAPKSGPVPKDGEAQSAVVEE